MSHLTFKVTAKTRSYDNCPVSATIAADRLPNESVILTDNAGIVLPCQIESTGDNVRIHWIIPSLAQGETRSYGVSSGSPPDGGIVDLTLDDETVKVAVGSDFFTTYFFGTQVARPYLHPLMGPSGSVTRHYPMEDVSGETRDHIHHRGCWVAWGDVNGVDNWIEEGDHARTVHRGIEVIESGCVFGRLRTLNDWVAADGTKLMEEVREYRFYNQPASCRAFDMTVRFVASEGPVRFGDTKEGGICSVRVATSMDATDAGTFENAYGAINEDEGWGKPSPWCDYYGPVNDATAGIAVMDHPGNFRYPTYWHVRNYGLMTANPFGLSYFHGPPEPNPDFDGSHRIQKDEAFEFRYHVLVHAGDTRAADVAGKYHHFINPPVVES